MPSNPLISNPEVSLIDIAATLTDRETREPTAWLKVFRRNYRHLAVTFGHHFNFVNLAAADKGTDSSLAPETNQT